MTDDKKAVPEPGEARRDDDEIHYHQVDETMSVTPTDPRSHLRANRSGPQRASSPAAGYS